MTRTEAGREIRVQWDRFAHLHEGAWRVIAMDPVIFHTNVYQTAYGLPPHLIPKNTFQSYACELACMKYLLKYGTLPEDRNCNSVICKECPLERQSKMWCYYEGEPFHQYLVMKRRLEAFGSSRDRAPQALQDEFRQVAFRVQALSIEPFSKALFEAAWEERRDVARNLAADCKASRMMWLKFM